MATVAQLAVDLIANTASFQRDMRRAADRAGRNLHAIETQTRSLNSAVRTVTDSVKGLGVAFGAYEFFNAGRSLVEAQREYQKIHYTLQAVTGSAKGANKEFKFLIDTSRQLGLDLEPTAQGYARMAASAQDTSLTTQQLHEDFRHLSEAFLVLHTSGDEINRMLIQLDQGLSLGKIQMRDLRAISQSFPGVFETVKQAFKGTGKTMQEMLAAGGIPAVEFLNRFTQVLHQKYGPVVKEVLKGIQASLNNLRTAWFQFKYTVSGGLFEQAVSGGARALTSALDAMREHMDQLMNAVGALAAFIGARLVGALAAAAGQRLRNVAAIAAQTAATASLMAAEARGQVVILGSRTATLQQAQARHASAAAAVEDAEATLAAVQAARTDALAKLELSRANIQQAQTALAAMAQTVQTTSVLALQRQVTMELTAATQARSAAMTELATLGTQQAAIEARLAGAETAAAAATTRLAEAQAAASLSARTMAVATRTLSVAMRGLKGIMAFLGGPAGVILIAGYALYKWYHNADLAAGSTKTLASELQTLAEKYRKATENQQAFIRDSLQFKLTKAMEARQAAVEKMQGLMGHQFSSGRAFVSAAAEGFSNLWTAISGGDVTRKTQHDMIVLYHAMKQAEQQAHMLRQALKNLGKPASSSGNSGGDGSGNSGEGDGTSNHPKVINLPKRVPISTQGERDRKALDQLRQTLQTRTEKINEHYRENVALIKRADNAKGDSAQLLAELQKKHLADLQAANHDTYDNISRYAQEAANNIQDSFANFLFDPFSDGLDGMLKGFANTLRRMVAEQSAAKLLGSIGSSATSYGGSHSGIIGSIASGIGSFFGGGASAANATSLADAGINVGGTASGFGIAGYRAAGGPVSAGATYLVGERGPELFSPGTSGAIIPNHAIAPAANAANVQVNIINNGQPMQPERQTTRRGPSGEQIIDIHVKQSLTRMAGSGELDSVFAPYTTRRAGQI